MAFKKPSVTKINADISNISIYLRSTKKFGKTTLFRDVILEKYGDPECGLLIGCGSEVGYKMLDGLNATQITSWDELIELKDWLISTKGTEHNIKIVAFDTADELALMAQKKTVKISNKENPSKPVRSIKAAMGGFMAGEMYAANDLVKPIIAELEEAGFGVWAIAHTAMRTIKDKGSLEEEGYQQLTSNLDKYMESALGDCFDVVLTGVVDRETEERGTGDKKKNYVTDTVRKLYFRSTTSIDAGGRFTDGAVPEYLVFDKRNMAKEFVQTVEEGMEKSKINLSNLKKVNTGDVEANKAVPKKKVETADKKEETDRKIDVEEAEIPFDLDDATDSGEEKKEVPAKDVRIKKIRDIFSSADLDTKKQIKATLISDSGDGKGKLDENVKDETLDKIELILDIEW